MVLLTFRTGLATQPDLSHLDIPSQTLVIYPLVVYIHGASQSCQADKSVPTTLKDKREEQYFGVSTEMIEEAKKMLTHQLSLVPTH